MTCKRLYVKPAVFCYHCHLDILRAKLCQHVFYIRRFDLQISAALFIINLLFLSIHQLHYRLEGLKDELRRNRGYNSRVTITAQRSYFPFANIALRYGFGLLLFLHFVERLSLDFHFTSLALSLSANIFPPSLVAFICVLWITYFTQFVLVDCFKCLCFVFLVFCLFLQDYVISLNFIPQFAESLGYFAAGPFLIFSFHVFQ